MRFPYGEGTRLEPAIFSNYGRHIFGTFRVEGNVQRHEAPYQLSSDPEMLDLE